VFGLLIVAVAVFHSRRILRPRIVVTSNSPAAIQTLFDAHINGFNTQNNDLFLSVFGDTAIIIDGSAPYRRLNPLWLRTFPFQG
jgi:tRNA(Met) C34 N-acetyltransferase TmcA